MGAASSSTVKSIDPEVARGSYICSATVESPKSQNPDMALTLDPQVSLGDDFGQDTLMGLQELDSQLSIFEDASDTPTGLSSADSVSDVIPSISQHPSDVPTKSRIHESGSIDSFTKLESASPSLSGLGWAPSVSASMMPPQDLRILVNGGASAEVVNSHSSMISSVSATDVSDASSLSSISSQSRYSDLGASKKNKFGQDCKISHRIKYDVRPKVSIPTDVSASEYARQCIAAAESSRLNPYALHVEEHRLLRAHLTPSQVTTYLNIRNGILRLWVRNPLIGVLRDEAIGCARDARWFDAAHVCYDWLVRNGYINYGCLETMASRRPATTRIRKRPAKTVAVIGAGMSGLGCARQLEGLFAHFEHRFRENGEDVPSVVVLEGRDRVGGRVYSRGFKSNTSASTLEEGNRCTAEMGGMIITGFDRGNPLNILVRGQLGLDYHALRPTTTLYDFNGQPVEQHRDQLAEKLYNDILDRVSDYKFKIPAPVSIEGDHDLVDACRDSHGDQGKSIASYEDDVALQAQMEGSSTKEAPHKNTIAQPQAMQVVPVSSDRLTGRAHVEPGIPAIYSAAQKARSMGWALRDGVDGNKDLELDEAVSTVGATLGSVMDAAIDQYKSVVHLLPLDLRLLNWHIANLEYSNAISYGQLSLGGWDVDAGNEWEGKHTQIVGGYQQVPRGLLHCPQPLNVQKKSAVKKISYSPDNSGVARIDCQNGTSFVADVVVSTISLGNLKADDVTFEPSLPSWKTGAIERLGFGILNKVVLVYKKPFWDTSRDIFGVLREATHRASLNQADYSSHRGRFFQWFNATKTSGLPTLVALMAGEAAFQTEVDDNRSLVAEATGVLRSVFGQHVPEPVEAIITRWGSDPFARGSYSYTGPNFRADDYETMAKPIGNLFFAGEHTCGTHPATVHGAYISGLRAASEIIDALIGPINVPEPLILPKDSLSVLKRKASELSEPAKDLTQLRLEAYEKEVWTAIFAKFGDYPIPPPKPTINPYILYGKAKFEDARKRCEGVRRPGKGKPVPNEVRTMLAKMWKEASNDERKPFQISATEAKQTYTADLAKYYELARIWDADSIAFRKEYEAGHPSIPSQEELEAQKLPSPGRRDRRVKRLSGYAEPEDDASDLEI